MKNKKNNFDNIKPFKIFYDRVTWVWCENRPPTGKEVLDFPPGTFIPGKEVPDVGEAYDLKLTSELFQTGSAFVPEPAFFISRRKDHWWDDDTEGVHTALQDKYGSEYFDLTYFPEAADDQVGEATEMLWGQVVVDDFERAFEWAWHAGLTLWLMPADWESYFNDTDRSFILLLVDRVVGTKKLKAWRAEWLYLELKEACGGTFAGSAMLGSNRSAEALKTLNRYRRQTGRPPTTMEEWMAAGNSEQDLLEFAEELRSTYRVKNPAKNLKRKLMP